MIHASWTKDKSKIKSVLCEPRIYDVISGDGAPNPEDFEIDLDQTLFIAGELFDIPVAVMLFHKKNKICWQLHIQIIPEFRKLYADQFAQKSLDLFFNQYSGTTLIAEIPTKYQNVVEFSTRHGFTIDGLCKDAYLKNNTLYDVVYLSLRHAEHEFCTRKND